MNRPNKRIKRTKSISKNKGIASVFLVLILLCLALFTVFLLKNKFGENEYIKSVISDDEKQYDDGFKSGKKQVKNNATRVQNYRQGDLDYLENVVKEKGRRKEKP